MAFKRRRPASRFSSKRRKIGRFAKGKRKPTYKRLARTRYSRKKTTGGMLSKFINNIAETKFIPILHRNEVQAVGIQDTETTSSLARYQFFHLGPKPPPTWSAMPPQEGTVGVDQYPDYETPSSLDGITVYRGDGPGQIDGAYCYFKKTRLSMEIDMSRRSGVVTKFRVICFKARRSHGPVGQSPDWAKSLFLGENNVSFGSATLNKDGSDLMLQPLNKRQFIIHSDKKFIMSPMDGNSNILQQTGHTFSSKYPSTKTLVYNLPHSKKVNLGGNFIGTTGPLLPIDYDFNWGIAIYARGLNKDQRPIFETNIRGVTTISDL